MKDFTFGILAKIHTDIVAGSVDMRFDKTRHDVKSIAGKLFRDPSIESVCVFDPFGISHLYLKKTAEGVVREELP
jgi:hypothetical protein